MTTVQLILEASLLRILVVDDDKEFLIAVRVILKSRSYEVSVFSDPVEAMKAVHILDPAIIVTDVMMPGVHGLDFVTIVRHIVRSAAVVVISANSKQQLEQDFGTNVWSDLTYFQKPLQQEFFSHLDTLRLQHKPNISTVSPNAAQALGQQAGVPLPIDQFEKLENYYEHVQGLVWEMALKKWEFTSAEYDAWHAADANLSAVLAILAKDDHSRSQILLSLGRSRSSWQSRVRDNLKLFLPETSKLTFAEPFLLDETTLAHRFHGLGQIRSLEIKVGSDFQATLCINEQPIALAIDQFDCPEGRIVNAARYFLQFAALAQRSREQHLWVFWCPERRLPTVRDDDFVIEFPQPWLTSLGAVSAVHCGADTSKAKMILLDGSIIVVAKDLLLQEPLPSQCVFNSKHKVSVNIDPTSLAVSGRVGDSILPSPLAQGEKAARELGYPSDGTKYWRCSWAINYLWDVAMNGSEGTKVSKLGVRVEGQFNDQLKSQPFEKLAKVKRKLFGS